MAVLAHNSANHLEAWLALPAHGWVINDLNLRLAASELAFMVDDSECTALLVDDDHLETGRELMDSCPSLRRLVYIGYLPEAPQDAVAWEEGFRANAVAEAIERERITLTLLVPTMIGMLLDHVERHPRDLSSLRLLMYAASPRPKETQRRAMAALDCDFTQMYGMTEAAARVTQSTPEDHRRGAAGEPPYVARLDSAGAEVVGVQCEVRDPITGEPVRDGEPGEIWVRGPNVMLGYWRREEEMRAVLTPDGWYRSGGLAYSDDHGYLYIVDRLKDMIIGGGENVCSTEVELAIYEHRAVAECAVFGVRDPRWGERFHAIVIPRAGVEFDEDALIEHLCVRIAGYKVPARLRSGSSHCRHQAPGRSSSASCVPPTGPGRSERCTEAPPDNER